MKNTLIISALFIVAFTVSCKKKRTCTCTEITTVVDTYPNGYTNTSTVTNSTTKTAQKQTKKYFRIDNACYNYTSKSTDNTGGYSKVKITDATCTLR